MNYKNLIRTMAIARADGDMLTNSSLLVSFQIVVTKYAKERNHRLRFLSDIFGREINSSFDLTRQEAIAFLDVYKEYPAHCHSLFETVAEETKG